jgi:hypothetical protein
VLHNDTRSTKYQIHKVVGGGPSVYFLFTKNRKPRNRKKYVNIFFTNLKTAIWGNVLQDIYKMLGKTSKVISHAEKMKKIYINIYPGILGFRGSPATWRPVGSGVGRIEHLLWICLDEQ